MNEQLQLNFNLNSDPQSNSESCGNCLCCMNKQMSQLAFCFELNQTTQLNNHCDKWEKERN